MKWIKRLFKKKRSDEDLLISILDSMVFVLLHEKTTTQTLTKMVVHTLYRNIQREAKNGRLEQLELKMKGIHQMVTQNLEKQKAI